MRVRTRSIKRLSSLLKYRLLNVRRTKSSAGSPVVKNLIVSGESRVPEFSTSARVNSHETVM